MIEGVAGLKVVKCDADYSARDVRCSLRDPITERGLSGQHRRKQSEEPRFGKKSRHFRQRWARVTHVTSTSVLRSS